MVLPAIIAAGATIGSSIYGANKSASSAKQANKFALLSQMMAQNHEKEKMKNAYQWTVEDMHKAGINPILEATKNGAGAGTGAGPAMQGQQSQEGQILAQGMQSAVATAQNQMDISNKTKLADTQSAVNMANVTKILKEAGLLNKYGEEKAIAEINNLNAQATNQTASAKNVSNTIGGATQGVFNAGQNLIKDMKKTITSAKGANNKKDFYKNVMFN